MDFRGEEEQKFAPDKLPVSVVNEFKLPIDPGNVISLMELTDLDSTQMDSIMMRMNFLFVSEDENIHAHHVPIHLCRVKTGPFH